MEVSVKVTATLLLCLISFSGVIGGFRIWKAQSSSSLQAHSTQYPKEIQPINDEVIGKSYPSIEAQDIYIHQNETFQPLEYAQASDPYAGDITQRMEVYGEVNTSVKGEYEIRYVVRNDFGLKTTKHMKVIVD